MSYLDPKIKYMNSVSGSSAGNLPDAEEAYWSFVLANGAPVGTIPAATSTTVGGVLEGAAVPDAAAAPTQAEFNALLASLRASGAIAT